MMTEQFLELSMDNLTSNPDSDNVPWCLVCGKQEQQLAHGNIFKKKLLCSQQRLGTYLAATLLTDFEIGTAVSEVICERCQKLVEESDLLETQLRNVQEELRALHYNTLWMLESGKLHFVKSHPAAPMEPRKKPRKVQQVPRKELPPEPIRRPGLPRKRFRGRRSKLDSNVTEELCKNIECRATSSNGKQNKTEAHPLNIKINEASFVDKDLNDVSKLKLAKISLTSELIADQNEENLSFETLQESNSVVSATSNLKRKRKTRRKKKELSSELQNSSDTLAEKPGLEEYAECEPESDEDRKDRDPDFQWKRPTKKLCLSPRLSHSRSSAKVNKFMQHLGNFHNPIESTSCNVIQKNNTTHNVATTSMTKKCNNSIGVQKVTTSSELYGKISKNHNNFGIKTETNLKVNPWEDNNNYSINEELIIKKEINSDNDFDGFSNEAYVDADNSLSKIKCEPSSVDNSNQGTNGNELVDNMCIRLKQMFACSVDPQLQNGLYSNSKEDLSMINGISNIHFANSDVKFCSEDEIEYGNLALQTNTYNFIGNNQSDLDCFCDICGLDFDKVEQLKNHIELDHFTPNY